MEDESYQLKNCVLKLDSFGKTPNNFFYKSVFKLRKKTLFSIMLGIVLMTQILST